MSPASSFPCPHLPCHTISSTHWLTSPSPHCWMTSTLKPHLSKITHNILRTHFLFLRDNGEKRKKNEIKLVENRTGLQQRSGLWWSLQFVHTRRPLVISNYLSVFTLYMYPHFYNKQAKLQPLWHTIRTIKATRVPERPPVMCVYLTHHLRYIPFTVQRN